MKHLINTNIWRPMCLLLSGFPVVGLAADYAHCTDTVETAVDAWLYHGDSAYFSSLDSDPQPVFEANEDGTAALKTLDMSTHDGPRDVPVSLQNAQKTRFSFMLSKQTAVRIELVSDKPGPHGELEISLFSAQGTPLFKDIDNGLYQNPSWITKHARNVPRIDTVLPAGNYSVVLCNSYVNDAGMLRLGRSDQDALTDRNPNPFVKDNDL